MTRLNWFALSFLLAGPLLAGNPITAERQQELRNLMIQDCGSCHGLTLRGGLGPALLPSMLQGKSADYISTVILEGRPGSAMPGWRPLLSEAEARWMAELLLRGELLARSSPQPSTATALCRTLPDFSSVRALNIESTMSAHSSVAKVRQGTAFRRLATKAGENCGLAENGS
jgi:cytochrome c55X